MEVLFRGKGFLVVPVDETDLPAVLAVYRQCEDFLALGPVPHASPEMVRADLDLSRENNGIFCGIWNESGDMAGVLDCWPGKRSFLELLMIAGPYRRRGLGAAVLAALESHLKTVYRCRRIDSGVQVNNVAGIKFWRAQGFRIGRRARHLPDKTTAFTMHKSM